MPNLWRLRAKHSEPTLDDFLLPGAFHFFTGCDLLGRGKVFEGRVNALQLGGWWRSALHGQPFNRTRQNAAGGAGRQRQPAIAIREPERALFKDHAQVPRLEHAAILFLEDWEEHLVLQLDLARVPVDVEIPRVN